MRWVFRNRKYAIRSPLFWISLSGYSLEVTMLPRLPAQAALFACALFLTSCGGGGGGNSGSTSQSTPPASSSAASSSSASSQTSSKIPDTLAWKRPTLRENKFTLSANDINGYVLRYKMEKDRSYTELSITPKGDTMSIALSEIPNSRATGMQFEVAAYTYDGLFSEFTAITPQ